MQNLKTSVRSALQTATALSTLTIYFHYPTTFNDLPCISYFEVDNVPSLNADDQEIGSNIMFQIDIWGRSSLSDYAVAVDTAMTGIDFSRIASRDLYDWDTKVHHKLMQFANANYSDPSF